MFAAELVLFGGDWFVLVPLLTLLPRLTGSGQLGGLVLAIEMGLQAVLLPYTGTVADRVDRRRILLTANCAGAVCVLSLLAVRTPGTAWIALVGAGTFAVAKSFYSPTAAAALPNVVEPADLATANALAGSAWGTMVVVGASLGGVVSALVGPYVCFLVTAVCLLLGAVLTWRIRVPLQRVREDDVPRPRTFTALREATRYVGRHPRVASLVTVKSAVGLGNGVLVAFPLLVTQFYRVGEWGTGLLFAARGLGALLGPVLFRWLLGRRAALFPILGFSMAAYGVGYAGVAMTPWFVAGLVLVALAHVAGGGNWAMSNYALQAEVPDDLRGRVFATDLMMATLAVAVSQLVAGAFVDHVSPRAVVAACGCVTFAYAVGWWLVTRRMTTRADAEEAASGAEDLEMKASPG